VERAGAEQRAVVPDIGQRDEQAGFVGVLGQQLEAPRRIGVSRSGRRLVDAEAQAGAGGTVGTGGHPLPDPIGQSGQLLRVRRRGEQRVGRLQCLHPCVGHGPPPAPAGNQPMAGGSEAGSNLGVDRSGERVRCRPVTFGAVGHHQGGEHLPVADAGQRPPDRSSPGLVVWSARVGTLRDSRVDLQPGDESPGIDEGAGHRSGSVGVGAQRARRVAARCARRTSAGRGGGCCGHGR